MLELLRYRPCSVRRIIPSSSVSYRSISVIRCSLHLNLLLLRTRLLLFKNESTPHRHMILFYRFHFINRQCGACIDIPGCRFDLDSMLCMKEDDGESSESTQWALDSSSCPELDDCGYTSCSTCAQHGCTWCDSLNRCMDESDTVFAHDCQGVMVRSEENCPDPFTSLTLVDGNLVVSGDVDLGGGALHVSDSSKGSHSLILDGGRFDVKSSGYVAISAANTDSPNVSASGILLQSGSSTSSAGGSGGDFFAFAGDGAGGECIHRLNC